MYTGCLVVTCLIANRANQLLLSSNVRRQRLGKALIILLILIFSLIAGLRDYSVGTDISYYGLPSFYKAQRLSAANYFVTDGTILEPLYVVLNFAITRIFNNYGIVLFALQLLTASFVLLRLCDYKYTGKIWLGVLIYNCFFFPISLNIMRQSVAMAMLFYATRYIFGSEIDAKIKRYVCIVICSMGFHVSGAIGFAILFIYHLYSRKTKYGKDKMTVLKTCALLCAMIVVVLLFDKIVGIIASLSSFTSKFSRYEGQSLGSIQLNPILTRLPFVIFPLAFWGKYKNKRLENYLVFILVVLDVIFSELRAYSSSLYRVSIYFAYFRMIEIPCLVESVGTRNRKILSILMTAICVSIWVYQIIYQGNESVFPYVFKN